MEGVVFFAFVFFHVFLQSLSSGTQFPNEIYLSFRELILYSEIAQAIRFSLYSFHIFQLFTPSTIVDVRESLCGNCEQTGEIDEVLVVAKSDTTSECKSIAKVI